MDLAPLLLDRPGEPGSECGNVEEGPLWYLLCAQLIISLCRTSEVRYCTAAAPIERRVEVAACHDAGHQLSSHASVSGVAGQRSASAGKG